MTNHQQRWAELAAMLRDAMRERGWDQIDFVRAASVSDRTIRDLTADPPVIKDRRPGVLAKVGHAVGWGPSAIADYIDKGLAPVPATDDPASPTLAELEVKLQQLIDGQGEVKADVDRSIARATRAVTAELADLNRRLVGMEHILAALLERDG